MRDCPAFVMLVYQTRLGELLGVLGNCFYITFQATSNIFQTNIVDFSD